MGIVAKQSIRNLLSTYIGFGIGAINVMFLYTSFLGKTYYGVVSYVLSASMLVFPIVAFGIPNALVKFFGVFKEKKEKDRFLTFFLVLPTVIGLVLGVVAWLVLSQMHFVSENHKLLKPYFWTIFVLAFSIAYFELFYAYARVHYKTVLGNFLKEVFHRILVTGLLIMVYYNFLSVENFVYALVGVYVIRVLLMKWTAFYWYKPKLSFGNFPRKREIVEYAFYMLIAGSVAAILIDLDKVMLAEFVSVSEIGIYNIAVFIAFVVAVPSRAMHQITYPLTAQLMHDKDTKGLRDLYKRSSLTLLLIAGFILITILGNLELLYRLIPPEFPMYFDIVLYIGLAKLLDSAMGNSNAILFNSDYYKTVLYFGIVVTLFALIFNLWCIPKYGLTGAAIATLMAFLLYNGFKLYFIWKKFRMQPFSKNSLVVLSLILVFGILGKFLKIEWSWIVVFKIDLGVILSILFKTFLLGVGYGVLTLTLKLSKDLNQIWGQIRKK